jgi:hypothetical protein
VLKKIDSDASEKIILHRKTFLQHCASALNRQPLLCCQKLLPEGARDSSGTADFSAV